MDSLPLILRLHTPEELIFYSNLVHQIEGGLFLVVVIIVFGQALGYWRKYLYVWPGLVLLAGFFLPLFSYAHHIGELDLAWRATIYDPPQRQHMGMAILLSIAGTAELVGLKKQKQFIWRLIFPGLLMIIGVLFITHPQHGTGDAVMRAALIHSYLGAALIAAGLFKAAAVFWTDKKLAVIWLLPMLLASVLLIIYREPKGAYQIDNFNHQQDYDHKQ